MLTVSAVPPSAGTFCDAAGTTVHDFRCLLDLAGTYYTAGKWSVALECLWGAFDTARRMGRPDLTFIAMDALAIVDNAATEAGYHAQIGGAS